MQKRFCRFILICRTSFCSAYPSVTIRYAGALPNGSREERQLGRFLRALDSSLHVEGILLYNVSASGWTTRVPVSRRWTQSKAAETGEAVSRAACATRQSRIAIYAVCTVMIRYRCRIFCVTNPLRRVHHQRSIWVTCCCISYML